MLLDRGLIQPTVSLMVMTVLLTGLISIAGLLISRRYFGALLLNVLNTIWVLGAGILLIGWMAVLSLAFGAHVNRHVDRVIAESELVGTWEPTSETLSLLFDTRQYHLSGKRHSLVLDDNGQLHFASMIPDLDSREGGYEFLETDGDWNIEQIRWSQKRSCNQLKIRLNWTRFDRHQSFFIMQRYGELVLWHSIGDPFEGEYIEYRRSRR